MKIHIIGGGIGGMSCALHLAKLTRRGHLDKHVEIIIYERSNRLGGKSQSQLDGFPGEHGFRFFPNFYRCIVDTLKDFELDAQQVRAHGFKTELEGRKVFDLLRDAPDSAVAVNPLRVVTRSRGLKTLPRAVKDLFDLYGLSLGEAIKFTGLLLKFLTSCEDRMLAEYEHETLDSFFFERHHMSERFREFVASLRALSAMRANRGSLRTLLFTATQMLVDFDEEYRKLDAVLPGPTDWLMIEPWQKKLEELGVKFVFGAALKSLSFQSSQGPGAVPALKVARFERSELDIELQDGADQVVLALPFEVARPLLAEAATSGPLPEGLRGALTIEQQADNLGAGAEPMVGIQFFLKRRTNMPRGHILYCRSKWAITSIAQGQFWESSFARSLADTFRKDGLQDIVSAIISGWDVPGANGKAPKDSTEDEILKEALHQMNEGLGFQFAIRDEDILDKRVDRDIKFGLGRALCTTPLWVSPAGSYLARSAPDAGCSNFFIASDWAKTEADVGSMESADEAARVVVRAIAERSALPPRLVDLPEVRPLRLWKIVELARNADKVLFDLGLPHMMSVAPGLRRGIASLATEYAHKESLQDFVSDPLSDAAPQDPTNVGTSVDDATAAIRKLAGGLDAAGYDPKGELSFETLMATADAVSS